MDGYEVEIINADSDCYEAKKKLAKWLLEFGLKIGTIHDPRAAGDKHEVA